MCTRKGFEGRGVEEAFEVTGGFEARQHATYWETPFTLDRLDAFREVT
jgi:hypothetical protein